MKKSFLLTLLVASAFAANAGDVKLGLRVAPGLAFNSVKWKADGEGPSNSGIGFSISVGPTVDFMFSDRAGFMTGLWFTTNRIGMSYPNVGGKDVEQIFKLQHIQLPAALKMYTDEVATDIKLYFLVGLTLDVRVSEKYFINDKEENYKVDDKNEKFTNTINFGVLGGMGMEYQLGSNTSFFLGITYNRGLINSVNVLLKDDNGNKYANDLKINTSQLALEVGLKF